MSVIALWVSIRACQYTEADYTPHLELREQHGEFSPALFTSTSFSERVFHYRAKLRNAGSRVVEIHGVAVAYGDRDDHDRRQTRDLISAPFFLGPEDGEDIAFAVSGAQALQSMKYFGLSECVIALVVRYRSPTGKLLSANPELARISEDSEDIAIGDQQSVALTGSIETKPRWIYITGELLTEPRPTAGPIAVPVSPR
jgi:hypothetical protein